MWVPNELQIGDPQRIDWPYTFDWTYLFPLMQHIQSSIKCFLFYPPRVSCYFESLLWYYAWYEFSIHLHAGFVIFTFIFNILLSLDSDWSIMTFCSLICPWNPISCIVLLQVHTHFFSHIKIIPTFVIISCPFNNMFSKLTFNEGGNLNWVIYTYFAVLTIWLYCTISHNPKLFKTYLHRKSYQTLYIEGWRNSIMLLL